MRRINNLDELRESLARGKTDFVVNLGHGLISRKSIFPREEDDFAIFDGVDGSFRRYSADELRTEHIIGRAMEDGRFFEDE